MKRAILILIGILAFSTALIGAESPKWYEDFDGAAELAQSSSKYMFVNFTGSDWCPWCMKLRDEIFKTEEFQIYARDHLILVEVDFPRAKQQSQELAEKNQKLAGKYGVQGLPTILLISPQGDLAATTGYRRGGAIEYVDHLKSLIKKYETTHQEKG